MAEEYSPFRCPIWLTGIWMPDIRKDSAGMGVSVLAAIGCLLSIAHGGLWLASLVIVIADMIFLSTAIGRMTRYLSIRDRFPFGNHNSLRVLSATFLHVVLLSFVNLGGPAAWVLLLSPHDSIVLRVIRLVAIQFVILMLSMLIGGAAACSHAEGKGTLAALGRMLNLGWRQRGVFFRAAVYGLPQWVLSCVMDAAVLFGALLVPFLVADLTLPLWCSVLARPSSLALRVIEVGVSIIVGIFFSIIWYSVIKDEKSKAQLSGKWRIAPYVALCATIWAFGALPFLINSPEIKHQLPFTSVIMSRNIEVPVGADFRLELGIIGVGAILAVAGRVGTWVLLYPASWGVFTFFYLRHEQEGIAHRSPADPNAPTKRGSLTAVGSVLFKSGGKSAIGSVATAGRWSHLIWLPTTPIVLIPSVALALTLSMALQASAHMGQAWRFAFLGVLACITMFLLVAMVSRNIICRLVGPEESTIEFGNLVRRSLSTLLSYVLLCATVPAALMLCSTLGIIPGVGPLFWALIYSIYFITFGEATLELLLSIPFAIIMVPAMVAGQFNIAPKSLDRLSQLGYYLGTSQGVFARSLLLGMVLTCVPGVILALCIVGEVLLSHNSMQGWGKAASLASGGLAIGDLADWRVCLVILEFGLMLGAVATSTVNGFLIIRRKL